MQRISNDIWISLGPEDNDTLRYAPACGDEGATTFFRFDAEHTPATMPAEQQDVLVLFNGKDGFMQQPARIVRVPESGGDAEPIFGFEATGDAVSAENREMFRVGVSLADYSAEIDGVTRKVADVSVLGLAFFSVETHETGAVVDVSFTVGDETFAGRCRVQSAMETGAGHRYGLLFIDGADAGDLEAGLRKLTMDAQRTQLKRMSRAG